VIENHESERGKEDEDASPLPLNAMKGHVVVNEIARLGRRRGEHCEGARRVKRLRAHGGGLSGQRRGPR
jgi:hypothetical protein